MDSDAIAVVNSGDNSDAAFGCMAAHDIASDTYCSWVLRAPIHPEVAANGAKGVIEEEE